MATAPSVTYRVAAGATVNAGRFAGGRFAGGVIMGDSVLSGSIFSGATSPAWWVDKPLGQWFSIPGTAGPGAGLATNAFSDLTIRTSDSTLFAVASGGHADGSSNAAAAITLGVDSPTWTTLRESSTPTENVLYYADGRPTSRHTYHHTHYIASIDAVLLAGCRFGWGGGTPTGTGMDLFSLSTNDYLPRYTWPDIQILGHYGVAVDGSGNVWTQTGRKFTVSTETWSTPGTGSLLRYPVAYDSTRDKLFALQWADGEGFGSGLSARQLDPATGNSVDITFNSSSALTAFIAAQPSYCGMGFCPLDGKFYFVNPAALNTLYVVTPNAGTTWDMTTLTVGGAALTTGATLCKRFLWVPSLSGFVIQHDQTQNLHFLRIA